MHTFELILRVFMIVAPIAFVLAAALATFYIVDEFRNHDSRHPGVHSRRKPRFVWDLVDEFRARKEQKQRELTVFFGDWLVDTKKLPMSLCRSNHVHAKI